MMYVKVLVIPEVQRLIRSQVAAGEGVSRQQRDNRLQVLKRWMMTEHKSHPFLRCFSVVLLTFSAVTGD